MAGQPKRRAMVEALEARTREYFEDDPTQTILDYVACWIEDGKTIDQLATQLDCPPQWISRSLRNRFGEEATDARLVASRARASHQIAEAALTLSDAPAETSVDVARNGLGARTRQWLAERWNPQQYGQRQQTNVAISITSLHLDALRHASTRVTGGPIMEVQASPDTLALPSQVDASQADAK